MLDRLPAFFLRIEGAAMFVAAIALYFHADYQWWLLLALILAPDLSAAGYLLGPRTGAATYDVGHLDAVPIALAVVGILTGTDVCVELALVWLAHIGMDRAIGYGLKYPTQFKDTHLQRL